MQLSIRYKILLPLLATVVIGFGSAGLIGAQAVSGQADVQSVVENAFAAKSLAAEADREMKAAAAVVVRVTDMTNFISAADVAKEFNGKSDAVDETIRKFSGVTLSSAVSDKVTEVTLAHKAWEADARLLLGLAQAAEIPTAEKLSRSFQAAQTAVDGLNSLVEQTAVDTVDAANGALSSRIEKELMLAGGIALVMVVLLTLIARNISGPVLQLSGSMDMLARGNSEQPIPFVARRDEIGRMAHAVEIFRRNAIAQAQLEKETELMRASAEAQRLEHQRVTEAQAQERLATATSGLAFGLKKLAAGDLSFQIEKAFSSEFEPLRHDFNQSVLQLAVTLSTVMESAESIDRSTNCIKAGSRELAGRTEQQAASLEETAAALNEVTAQVRQSTERAEDARNLANQANHSALASADVVAKAVTAMGRIESSSSQVNNIIGVIDQIAFQTNLLALNAGVEAARAGDAGKGFAVVAQEVRDLAQRSGQAAREIKALIDRSGNEVQAGVALVNQTGAALHDISDRIAKINHFMDAITESAREQSSNLTQVNAAMHQMDTVTQQNAAKVGETEAASHMLAEETERLQKLISQFDLNGNADRRPASGTGYALAS
ncbi:methyl-accepting chemotaxis protein [Rhizobium sp. TRM95111]|uniref:methyl-accepting chemotaxis protein n=1 Tax=Rhizobium alarense TaxID=2846851 RepID=UPI001F2DDB4D|nr:methyl-accepting chemotaxis protein [Rhizobium alarense]MCF3642664.1 methyl-accepting chemotaxis protein [Rhizobium alarense]